jgi:hypothetical protein
MYCLKCGSEIGDDSIFCSKCGAKVSAGSERLRDARNLKIAICCAVAVAAVIATVFAAFSYYGVRANLKIARNNVDAEVANARTVTAVINDLRRVKTAAMLYYFNYSEWPLDDWPNARSLDRYLDSPLFGPNPDDALYGLSISNIVLDSSIGDEKTLIGFDLEKGENSSSMNAGVRKTLARKAAEAKLLNEKGDRYDGGRFIYIYLK